MKAMISGFLFQVTLSPLSPVSFLSHVLQDSFSGFGMQAEAMRHTHRELTTLPPLDLSACKRLGGLTPVSLRPSSTWRGSYSAVIR